MTCKNKPHRTIRNCNKPEPRRDDYIPGGGGFGIVLIGAFVLWLLGCCGVLSLIF